ncbi:MAG: hypothetical protein VCB79_03865 [Dehalococcoidia bacterium]
MLEHKGMRWGYVFLRAASHIGEEEALVIMEQAVEMFLVGEEERNIKNSGFEGKLYTEMRYEIIGSLGGQRFDADLETPYGRDKASFLVSEQTQGLGGRISRN